MTETSDHEVAASSHRPIERVLPWLLRIATNVYIDGWRRPAPIPVAEPPALAAEADPDPVEVRDAVDEMTALLPPQERAAVVLKDVFDLPLAEIAAMLSTSVGAVKAALHRGRERLAGSADHRAVARARRPAPDRRLVEEMARAFTAYDLESLTGLLLRDVSSEILGMVYEVGADAMRQGSLEHTLTLERDIRYRGEVVELDGEPVLALFETPVDGSYPESLSDLLRVETADGGIARIRWYYFCPATLTEVAERLGVPHHTHGYRLGE